MTNKAKKVQWAIIHLVEVKPVNRMLNMTIDILMTPTETKKKILPIFPS